MFKGGRGEHPRVVVRIVAVFLQLSQLFAGPAVVGTTTPKMGSPGFSRLGSFSVGAAIVGALAFSMPHLPDMSAVFSLVGDFSRSDYAFAIPFFQRPSPPAGPFVCDPSHTYKTSLVSLDPLVIYIQSLLTPSDISSLLATADARFAPSTVVKYGRGQHTTDRTSSSAGLPRDDAAVMCVLNRSREFMGTLLRDSWDEMGPPQLVRYREDERFNIHHDWYETPQWANDGSRRQWNRVASFFAILQDNCTGGETHFPYISGISPPSPRGESGWAAKGPTDDGAEEPLWREHESGGLAFRPIAGNAIFWINLFPNGTGDRRTMHAGLPVEDGLKTAMNIWPRQYYPSG
jgi:prolyl 4-hydroxylase